ncbi:LysR family transcriptional regulator [Streptomyces sp. NPDC057654]|uniref:LysR family transcriptional regulator n=1 Tax=Streptomyces sp. NPDC057654 TaxID=3346196 RepID=UPI0036C709B8
MELRQLEYLVTVVEEASFTKAAAKLHVAQPGVSAQVKQLERELGQELLDRSGRTVRPTEAGAAVLPYARAALAAVADARFAVDELTGLLRGRVAVGMVTSCAPLGLPDLLADFHKDHPGVEINLVEDNSDRLIAALRAGRLDTAVVGLAGPAPQGIATETVADEPVVAVVSHDDPLAGRTGLAFDALRDQPLISLPRGTGLRTCLDEACAAAGFAPRIAFEASDPNVLAQLAARGLGVAILPGSLAAYHRATLHTITFTGPELRGRLALAWRGEGPAGPAARALIERARRALAPVRP